MKGIQVFIVRASLAGILAGCILCVLLLFAYSYQDFTATISAIVGQQDKLEKFRALLLTPERFLFLRYFSVFMLMLALAGTGLIWKRATQVVPVSYKIKLYWKIQFQKFILFWKSLPLAARYTTLLLFLLIIISRLFFVFRFPFHVDERFSYLYFVHKGFAVSMAYYPGPNNHIFYTLLCNLLNLFIDDPVWVMKLPALFIGLGLSATFWLLVSRYFSYPVALLATALFSFAEPVFYYSMQGRGYVLLMWFVLIATHSALKIIRMPAFSFSGFFWFWLSCTLGFYTIPVFLYPFAGLCLFIGIQLLIQQKYGLYRPLLVVSAAVVGCVGLLYLPVIVFNGWAALSGNAWVAPMPWHTYITLWPAHLQELASGLWGIIPAGEWLTILTVIFCLASLLSKKTAVLHKYWMHVYLLNLIGLVTIALLQRVLLPVRVLYYLGIYQYSILAYAGSKLIHLVSAKIYDLSVRHPAKQVTEKATFTWVVVASAGLAFACASSYQFYRLTMPGQFSIYRSFDATARWLYHQQADTIFANDYDYSLCIRFVYETNGKKILLDTNQPTPGRAYTYLVIHQSHPFPAQLPASTYNRVYADTEVVIYQKE